MSPARLQEGQAGASVLPDHQRADPEQGHQQAGPKSDGKVQRADRQVLSENGVPIIDKSLHHLNEAGQDQPIID